MVDRLPKLHENIDSENDKNPGQHDKSDTEQKKIISYLYLFKKIFIKNLPGLLLPALFVIHVIYLNVYQKHFSK